MTQTNTWSHKNKEKNIQIHVHCMYTNNMKKHEMHAWLLLARYNSIGRDFIEIVVKTMKIARPSILFPDICVQTIVNHMFH